MIFENPILGHVTALPAPLATFHNNKPGDITQDGAPTQLPPLSWCVRVVCFSDARPPAFQPCVYIGADTPLSLCSPSPSSPSLSILHCTPAGCNARQATHTHIRTCRHAHSKFGGVLPSTDARRITVRAITVNICSMSMMRLAERRRGG